MARIDDSPLVVSVAWVSTGSWLKELPDGTEKTGAIYPGWGVGFYKRSNIHPEDIVEIDGIEFVLDERLNGKALDFTNGKFVVIDGAI